MESGETLLNNHWLDNRGGSLSFLVGTISNVLVMEIGWTDVGSGGCILVSCAHSNTSLKQFCFVHANIIFIAIRFFVCFPVCSFSAFSILFYHLEVFDCHSIVFSSLIFLFACFLLYLFFHFVILCWIGFMFLPVSFHSYRLCRDLYFFFWFFPLLNPCFFLILLKKNIFF